MAPDALLDEDRLALLELLGDEWAEDEHVYPLSDAQYRLWFADRVEENSVLFNFQSALEFTGDLPLELLRRAYQRVARRHLVLTARIEEHEDGPVQRFDPGFVMRIPVIDLSALPTDLQGAALATLFDAEAGRVFDLARGPLFHIMQLRCSDARSVLLMSMHHIVSDGWSSAIFIRELLECFQAEALSRPPQLEPLDIQYGDFVYWQQERLAEAEIASALDWWQHRLRGVPTLRLPLDRPRSARRDSAGAVVTQCLPAMLVDRLQAIGTAQGATLFAVLLAGFKLLLSRYHGGTDIAVGTSVASRPLPELEGLIGLFVNQLVLRTDLEGAPSFRQLVERVSQTTVDALARQEVPFDRVVAATASQREPGISPLFQVLFLLNNMPKQALPTSGELTVRSVTIPSRAARFDLSLTLESRVDGGLDADFGYRSDIFDAGTIRTMAERYLALLERVAADPVRPIDTIEFLTEAEKQARANDMQKRQETRSDRFKGARRKAIDLGSIELVREGYLDGFEGYPLVITPASSNVDLADWAASDRAGVEQRLLRHGAILFRGFSIDSVERFERFARAVCPDLVGDYGDLPKESRGEKVYKSTPYPEDKAILFHNESSHTHRWPMKQFFSCIQVAPVGGETPIVDCRALYRQLSPELAARLAERGLLYVRNFIEGLDVSWQDFFKTGDRAEVEAHLERLGTQFTWTGENNLRICQRARAVARHPKTGDMVFFNQIQLHHIGYMEPVERESLLTLFSESDLPRNVYYGDGSPIEPEVIDQIDRLYAENAIAFPWESGDVLVVDNMITAHGRYPFKGQRKVVVAMGEMLNASDLPEVEREAIGA